MNVDFIAYSVPLFFILIMAEFVYGVVKHQQLYRLNDAITNLSCGIGQQVLGAWLKIIAIALFGLVYDYFRIFTIPDTVWTWLLLFIGVDFCYYWFHRISHEVNAIWATHIVHHQSEEYNLSVALRQSWFQTCFSMFFYIPLAILGYSPAALIAVIAFNTLYQFWIHTKTIKSMGPVFEYFFNTPSHHRVHHGSNPEYIDKNHAGTLMIWDRMFGTFQPEKAEVVYGITTPLKSWDPWWANFHYWVDLFKQARTTKYWSDKWKVFVKPPGWYPDDLGGIQSPPPVDAKTAKKFDIKIPNWINWYNTLQYIIVIGITSYFMFQGEQMFKPGNSAYIPKYTAVAIYILISLYTIGQLFENKRWGFVAEIFRHLSIIGVLIWYASDPYFTWIASIASVWSLASIVFVLIKMQRPAILKTSTT